MDYPEYERNVKPIILFFGIFVLLVGGLILFFAEGLGPRQYVGVTIWMIVGLGMTVGGSPS